MPPSSLYCCQASVSRISAAARNRKMAASCGVSGPPWSSLALADNPNATVPAPTARLVCKKDRRVMDPSLAASTLDFDLFVDEPFFIFSVVWFIIDVFSFLAGQSMVHRKVRGDCCPVCSQKNSGRFPSARMQGSGILASSKRGAVEFAGAPARLGSRNEGGSACVAFF